MSDINRRLCTQKALFFISFFAFFLPLRSQNLADKLFEFKELVLNHRHDLEEFQEIHKWAAENNLRVWLLGDSATAYARSVKRNFLEEEHPPIPGGNRLDFWDVFDLFQDITLVIDGNEADCLRLKNKLSNNFPFFTQNQNSWYVRPLYAEDQTETGLLDAYYQKKHADLFSLALLELSDPPENVDIVQHTRHLNLDRYSYAPNTIYFHWLTNSNPYMWNPHYKETLAARSGIIPPYISALQYLKNMDRYGLEIDAQSMDALKKVIHADDIRNIKKHQNREGVPIDEREIAEPLVESVSRSFYQLTVGARDLRKVIEWLKELGILGSVLDFPVFTRQENPDAPPYREHKINFSDLISDLDAVEEDKHDRQANGGFLEKQPSGHIHSKRRVPLSAVHTLVEGDVVEGGSLYLNQANPAFLVDPYRESFLEIRDKSKEEFHKHVVEEEGTQLFKSTAAFSSFLKKIAELSKSAALQNNLPGYHLQAPYLERTITSLDAFIVSSVLLDFFQIPTKIVRYQIPEHTRWLLLFKVPKERFKNQGAIPEDAFRGYFRFNSFKQELEANATPAFSFFNTEAQQKKYLDNNKIENVSLWYNEEQYKDRPLCETHFKD